MIYKMCYTIYKEILILVSKNVKRFYELELKWLLNLFDAYCTFTPFQHFVHSSRQCRGKEF